MPEDTLQNIIHNFSPEKFIQFFRLKNRAFRPYTEPSPEFDDDQFTHALFLGEIPFNATDRLVIYSFKVNRDLTERSGKKLQYEMGKKILTDEQSDSGIFIFYDEKGNFRFSLIYTDYTGTRRQWSYFKRFTYFVSPELTNKTFLRQIGEADFTSIEDIKEAFSVEPVTRQFYNELQTWYFWAMDKIRFPEDYRYNNDPEKDREIRNATSLIRLITRIIFIWFLKEKELIPPKLFSDTEMKSIVKDIRKDKNSSNYYNAILQNLFFATLNQKMSERRFASEEGYPSNKKEYGVKTLFRYADMFLIDKQKVLELFRDIPFLNGGLFDCLDKEDEEGKVIYIDGFSRKPKKRAVIPDYLFLQKEEQRVDLSEYGLGTNKTFRGLIEILNSYNFTIDENTPVDQEVALDPELLGKVFENLLASYNPETATTARKATGSYYTPREIVDYMVEESICEYLKTSLPEIDEDRIRLLLSYSEEVPEFTEEEKMRIISAIDRIKILDPACGSGAFPMGVLHKLVHVLQRLDPDNKHWYELQYQKALKESEEVFKQSNTSILAGGLTKQQREERLKEINETFDESINYPDFARKLYLIENCIYGVDIQPIAIQIAKLRFFISLVLDQKVDRTKENLGIRALPNLETKFVSANILVGLDRPEQMTLVSDDIRKLEQKIQTLRHRYFQAKTRTEKRRLQNKDRELRETLAEKLESLGLTHDAAEKVARFDLFDQNATADWFDPEWMFGVTDGFDIVIGNPPYIKEYTNRKAFDGLRSSPYYQGKMDIWYFFVCVGLDLLKDNGTLTFIAQNNWITNFGAKKMRNKTITDSIIKKLTDFGPYFIFESSGTQTMIMIFKKDRATDNYLFEYRRIKCDSPTFKDVLDILNGNNNPHVEHMKPTIIRSEYMNKPLNFSNADIERVLQKLKKNGTFNFEKNEITTGIDVHQDFLNKKNAKRLGNKFPVGAGIFVITEEEKQNLNLTSEELEIIKPYYTTDELQRYYGNRNNRFWIIYAKSDMNKKIHRYPNIKRHLDQFKKIISSDFGPYGLHRARDERFFKGEKIVSLRKCQSPTFTYTDFDCYVSQTFFVIKTDRVNMKYLTAILNSKVVKFWLSHKGKQQGNLYQIDKEPLMNIPIPKIPESDQKPFIDLVDKILSLTQSPDYPDDPQKKARVKKYERQIDQMVYELYGLTDEEIRIVEG